MSEDNAVDIMLSEIMEKIDTLNTEQQKQIAENFVLRKQEMSVFEKLKSCNNSIDAAKVLLLHKTNADIGQDCGRCGMRYICSQFLEGKYNNLRCVPGIAKELDKQFEWGEAFYDVFDKYEIKDDSGK